MTDKRTEKKVPGEETGQRPGKTGEVAKVAPPMPVVEAKAEAAGVHKTEEGEMTERKFAEQEMQARLEEIERTEGWVVGGQTSIDDEVIGSIASIAAKEVQGVARLGTSSVRRTLSERLGGASQRTRGVGVEAGKKEAIVDLTLVVIYGFSIPQIIIEVRKRVASRLLEMAGLIAKEINVTVSGIEFPERMPGKLE